MKNCEFCGVLIDYNFVTQRWEDDESDSVFRYECPENSYGNHIPEVEDTSL